VERNLLNKKSSTVFEKRKAKEKNYFREIRAGSLQNGPATKWATQKRATSKRAAPKWLRHKVVYRGRGPSGFSYTVQI